MNFYSRTILHTCILGYLAGHFVINGIGEVNPQKPHLNLRPSFTSIPLSPLNPVIFILGVGLLTFISFFGLLRLLAFCSLCLFLKSLICISSSLNSCRAQLLFFAYSLEDFRQYSLLFDACLLNQRINAEIQVLAQCHLSVLEGLSSENNHHVF